MAPETKRAIESVKECLRSSTDTVPRSAAPKSKSTPATVVGSASPETNDEYEPPETYAEIAYATGRRSAAMSIGSNENTIRRLETLPISHAIRATTMRSAATRALDCGTLAHAMGITKNGTKNAKRMAANLTSASQMLASAGFASGIDENHHIIQSSHANNSKMK